MQRQVAALYALNSFGAVLGAGFAGFVTLPWFGLYASLALASLLNVAAGVVVYKEARHEAPINEVGASAVSRPGAKRQPSVPVRIGRINTPSRLGRWL